jgi:hypothetical protein
MISSLQYLFLGAAKGDCCRTKNQKKEEFKWVF